MHKPSSQSSASSTGGSSPNTYHRDTRIEEGKLFYEKRWFRRGQSVQVEPKNGDKFPAMISAIGTEAIWVRRTNDSTKMRIYLTQLTKGKYVLKRRAV
jgi:Sin3 histone deacetylase corepressor complex component SDS3